VVNAQTRETGGDFLTTTGVEDPNQFTDKRVALKAFQNQMIMNAFPERAKQDPILNEVLKAKEARDKQFADLGRSQYVPKVNAFNEQVYAAYKGSTGRAGINSAREEIQRIDKLLAEEGKPIQVPSDENIGGLNPASYETRYPNPIPPEVKARLLKEREAAQVQLFKASYQPDVVGGVQFRSNDRTIMNQANDQLSVTTYNALKDMSKGFWGNVEMIGDKTGWTELKDNAKRHVNGIKMVQDELPYTLSSFRDVNYDQGFS